MLHTMGYDVILCAAISQLVVRVETSSTFIVGICRVIEFVF